MDEEKEEINKKKNDLENCETIKHLSVKFDQSESNEPIEHKDFSKLEQSLQDGNDEQFIELIVKGDFVLIDGIPQGPNGQTPVHLVCQRGKTRLLKKLFGYDKNVTIDYSNAMNMFEKRMGFTPFLVSVMNENEKCFQILIDKMFDLLQKNKLTSQQILVSFTSDKQSNSYFLGNMISMDQRTNLFHLIAQQNSMKILEHLFSMMEKSEDLRKVIEPMLTTFDRTDSTPLHIAARLGHCVVCKRFIELAILSKETVNSTLDEVNSDQSEDEDNELCEFDNDRISIRSTHGSIRAQQFLCSSNRQIFANKKLCSTICQTLLTLKNQSNLSAIHEAVERGHLNVVRLFTQLSFYRKEMILSTITDKNNRTLIHLAALKGHVDIVEFILKHISKKEISRKDLFGSTPVHCAAQVDQLKHQKSALIMDKFIQKLQKSTKIIDWSTQSFIEPFTQRDNNGYNCLEIAIVNQNQPFVKSILNLNKDQWTFLMENAQLTENETLLDTPIRKLIRYMPKMALKVFDRMVEMNSNEIIYDFRYIEDQCFINQWRFHNLQTSENDSNGSSSCCSNSIKYKEQNSSTEQLFYSYTNDPRIVMKNHVLSVIKNYSADIDVHNIDQVKLQSQLMEHPLCDRLKQLKWNHFGYFMFLMSFTLYCLFVLLFTWSTLRTSEPRTFYDSVNVSFNSFSVFQDTKICEIVFKKLQNRSNEQIGELDHRKDRIDYLIKYSLIVIISLYLLYSLLLLIGVYRLEVRGRLYAEIVALILCFFYIFDNPKWQNGTRLRCFTQWQIGSFGLFLSWSTLLAHIRIFPYVGLYVVMLEVIIIKFIWFSPILIILICSFAFSFLMLLQNQIPFQNPFSGWMRSGFMILDMNYEERVHGLDGQLPIVYPIVYILFIFYGITIAILVNNLLIGLSVGEIPVLSQLARLYESINRYESLNSCEIFRLRYFCKTSIIHFNEKKIISNEKNSFRNRFKWFKKHFILRPRYIPVHLDENLN